MAVIPETYHLFVVDITYSVPLAQIDEALGPHIAFLERHYASGLFLASGPKVPREGGVILAASDSRDTVEAALAEDPFQTNGLATYRVTEFNPVKRAPALQN